MSEKETYVCTACGYAAPFDEFFYSEHDPVNDGWEEFVMCPECGAKDAIQKRKP